MVKNDPNIPDFLTEKKSILLFLGSVFLFAVIFIAIYKPAGYMRTDEALSHWNTYIYTAIQVVTGFVILVVSRILLYWFAKKHRLKRHYYLFWLFGEVVFIILILTLLAVLLNARNNLDGFQLMWRVTYNTAAVLFIPYVISVLLFLLREKHHQIEELNKLISTMEAKPTMGDHFNFYDRGGKLSFSTRRENVLYLEAADNYCNIHYINEGKEDTIILHNSMKQIDESDFYTGLLRCHRSYMVNIENVKLLRKDRDGLVLELAQGTHAIPVSRTYNERVVRHFANMPSSAQ